MIEALIFLLIGLLAILFLSLIPASMARTRGRSQFGWFICSLLLSPLIAILILLCLGETDARRLEKIREEEELRASIRKQNNY